jgi:hypothetical protein
MVEKTAFIYSNINIYRLCMNLLYSGNYYKRFDVIRKLIRGKKVTELCFGDTVIADFCRKNNLHWTGYDINPVFVKNAVKKNFNAHLADINSLDNFIPADVCLMAGSLYHFHPAPEKILEKMLKISNEIILSEPIINLSSREGLIGKLAKTSAAVSGKKHSFRFTEESLLKFLNEQSHLLNFRFNIADRISKDIIIVINRK